jgi:predicted TIM-barrel fold metal-dependent hydrolase
MTFVMHHPMPLYFEETLSIASRFPNIYLVASPLFQLSLVKPRLVQELVGQLLQWVGPDRLIYGSEGAMGGNTTRYVQAVMDFKIADDLREGYGYPEVTREDKEKILGLNVARVFGIDLNAKRESLAPQLSGA